MATHIIHGLIRPREIIHPDTHRLRAAEGWLGLGDWREANSELEAMAPWTRGHPDVLALRFQVCVAAGAMLEALAIGEALVRIRPNRAESWINQGVALLRLGRYAEAFRRLKGASNRFPKNPHLALHLARCSARLGRMADARWWILEAVNLAGEREFSMQAVEDPDLQGIW